jgi:predicted dinucleotide-binding enzyme
MVTCRTTPEQRTAGARDEEHDGAKKTVTQLIESLGWQNAVADLGGIEESRYLEPMCIVWVHYGIRTGSWDHAFKMLRK